MENGNDQEKHNSLFELIESGIGNNWAYVIIQAVCPMIILYRINIILIVL